MPPLSQLTGVVLDGQYALLEGEEISAHCWLYSAVQSELNRGVHVHVLATEHEAAGDLFKGHALASSRLNHPNVASMLELGHVDGEFWYLVSEKPLGDCVANFVSLSLAAILEIANGLLSALEEAHAHGLVHGALSADDVYAVVEGSTASMIKVANFGVSADFLGQPMSPHYGPADDVKSAAALVEQLLSGIDNVPTDISGALKMAQADDVTQRPSANHLRRIFLSASDGSQVCPACGASASATQKFCAACGLRLLDQPNIPDRFARGTYRPDSPIEVARSINAPRTTSRVTLEDLRAPLIGRQEQLKQLREFCLGQSPESALALVGPIGVGKARILRECQRLLRGEVAMFATGPDPSGTTRPWYPISALCHQILGISSKATISSLDECLQRLGLPPRDALPLADILSIQSPHSELELAVRRRECKAAIIRLINSVPERFPKAVLAFADIDQYDEPSRMIVDELLDAAHMGKQRVILTTDQPRGFGPAKAMQIDALSESDSQRLLHELTGITIDAEDVFHITEGYPQAIEQLAGWLAMGNDINAVPAHLVELLAARIEQLPVVPRRIIQACAIHGSFATHELVRATLGVKNLPEVDEAVWNGLVTEEPLGYTILSPLIARVASETIPIELRRKYHQRAWDALSGHASHVVLARHADGAGAYRDAFDLYLRAGEAAANRFDDPGAAEVLSRALNVARRLSSRGSTEADDYMIDAATRLAFVLRCSGHPALASGVVEEASLFVSTVAHRAKLARARSGIHLARGHADEAVREARAAITLGQQIGDLELLCYAYLDLAAALDRGGQTDRATQELLGGIEIIGTDAGDTTPSMLWQLALRLADRLLRAGKNEESLTVALAALGHAGAAHSRRGQARCCELLATIYTQAGDDAQAARYRDQALRELTALGDRRSMAKLMIGQAEIGNDERQRRETLDFARTIASEIGWNSGI